MIEKLKENILRLAERNPLFRQFETDKWVSFTEATTMYKQLGQWEVRRNGPNPLVIRVINGVTIVFCGTNLSVCIHYYADGGVWASKRIGNEFINTRFDERGFWARTPKGRVYKW